MNLTQVHWLPKEINRKKKNSNCDYSSHLPGARAQKQFKYPEPIVRIWESVCIYFSFTLYSNLFHFYLYSSHLFYFLIYNLLPFYSALGLFFLTTTTAFHPNKSPPRSCPHFATVLNSRPRLYSKLQCTHGHLTAGFVWKGAYFAFVMS